MVEDALASRLAQLNQARTLVDHDASYFPQIVIGVLPVFTDSAVELRRWVADFVLVAFSSTKLSLEDKQDLALKCLDKLTSSIISETDPTTSKSFIQISAAVYPLLFRHVAVNPQSAAVWKQVTTLKSAILNLWESSNEGIRVCCLKFAQRVIGAQSPGVKDPRLASKSDITLSIVMADHPLLNLHELSAETDALLDRLISILSDRPADPILITAAVNCLCVLVKTRASISVKIISAILNCESPSIANEAESTKSKLQIRFVDKSIRVMLTHLLKSNAAGSMGNKIQQYLVGRARKSEEENPKKRQATEAVESAGKRLRTEIDGSGTPQPSVLSIPPLPEGPVTLATVFNLANDNSLAAFDVNQLPQELITQIILATLVAVNQEQLDSSIQTIRSRCAAAQSRITQQLPDGQSADTKMSLENGAQDGSMPASSVPQPAAVLLPNPTMATPGPFKMPEPLKFSQETLQAQFCDSARRIMDSKSSTRQTSNTSTSAQSFGIQKLFGAAWDKETWTSVVTRLATRGVYGLTMNVKQEMKSEGEKLADFLRAELLAFVMADFRNRIDFCASWLNEEWYSEKMSSTEDGHQKQSAYEVWFNRSLDAMLPFLESKDRSFMRFLSDVPELTNSSILKLRVLCVDPDRSQLGYTTLQYLIMLRPPVRTMCLDLVEQLYHEDQSEVVQQKKILGRWRPAAIAEQV